GSRLPEKQQRLPRQQKSSWSLGNPGINEIIAEHPHHTDELATLIESKKAVDSRREGPGSEIVSREITLRGAKSNGFVEGRESLLATSLVSLEYLIDAVISSTS